MNALETMLFPVRCVEYDGIDDLRSEFPEFEVGSIGTKPEKSRKMEQQIENVLDGD